MDAYQFLQMGKASVKGVRGIGDGKLRILLVGKQIGQIGTYAAICRPQPLMGIVPSSRCRINGSFSEKQGPSVMPGIKGSGKILLMCFAEHCGKFFQFNAGLELRVVCQIPCHDLFLVEVAHLDGDVGEELSYSRSTVKHNGPYTIPLVLQGSSSLPVCINQLVGYFLCVEIFLKMGGTEDADPEISLEECCISNQDNGLRTGHAACRFTTPYPGTNPVLTSSIFDRQMSNGLALIYVFLPQLLFSSLLVLTALKLSSTYDTPVSLPSLICAFLLSVMRTAIGTVFLPIFLTPCIFLCASSRKYSTYG